MRPDRSLRLPHQSGREAHRDGCRPLRRIRPHTVELEDAHPREDLACKQPALDVASARAFGRLAASLRRSGREARPRALDVLIASVAVANDLPLYTCNPSDYAGMEDLTLVAVLRPGAD